MKDPIIHEGTKRGGKYVIVDPSVPGYAEALLESLLGDRTERTPALETDAEGPAFDAAAAVEAFYEQSTNDRAALRSVVESLTDDEELRDGWEEELRHALADVAGEFLWSFWWDSGPRPMGDMASHWAMAEVAGTRWIARAPDRDLGEVGYELDRPAARDDAGLRRQADDAIREAFRDRVPDRIGFGPFMRRRDLMTSIAEALDDRGWGQLRKLVERDTRIDWSTASATDREELLSAYLGVAMGRAY